MYLLELAWLSVALPSGVPALCRHGFGEWTSGFLTCVAAAPAVESDHVVMEPNGVSPEPVCGGEKIPKACVCQ